MPVAEVVVTLAVSVLWLLLYMCTHTVLLIELLYILKIGH